MDHIICSIYGDHLHCNNITHFDGGVSNDAVWQHCQQLIRNLPTKWYDKPQGCMGRRFVQWMMVEVKGVRTRVWNSERPFVFVDVVLP